MNLVGRNGDIIIRDWCNLLNKHTKNFFCTQTYQIPFKNTFYDIFYKLH